MKITRNAPKPQPSRQIKKFTPPALGPHHGPPAATPPTPSNKLASAAVRIAGDKNGKINPKQQVY
jgi:hypothetical protein